MRIPRGKDGGLGLRDRGQGRGKKKVEGYLRPNRLGVSMEGRETEGRSWTLPGNTRSRAEQNGKVKEGKYECEITRR